MVIVDAAGGGNFTSPVAALNSILDADPLKPYLVRVLPGAYDIGTTGIVMKPFVDLEGSGEGITLTCGAVNAPIEPPPTALVTGADGSEVRGLTLFNGAPVGAVGFLSPSHTSPVLRNLKAMVSAPAFSFGICNESRASPRIDTTLRRVVAMGLGSWDNVGVASVNGTLLMEDVDALASAGSAKNVGVLVNGYYPGSPAVLRRVKAEATGPGNGAAGNAGVWVAHDDSGTGIIFLGTTTAELSEVVATASSSLTMNTGILAVSGGAPAMTNVTAKASGAGSRGLHAMGFNAGGAGSASIFADRCTFEGATGSLGLSDDYIAWIGASKLAGGATREGTAAMTCVGSYSGSYQALGPNCLVPAP